MEIVSLEVRLKQNHKTIRTRPVGEIIHQQIKAHSRTGPEKSGKPEGHGIPLIQQESLDVDFQTPVYGNGLQGSLFVAIKVLLPDPIAAVLTSILAKALICLL